MSRTTRSAKPNTLTATDPKYFDVIDELFLTDVGRLAVLGDHGPSLAAMRRLEEELLDLAATRAFIAETVVSIP